MPDPIDNPVLADLAQRLRSAFDPCTIWLFGSRAAGQPKLRSDYDVLVVVRQDHETPFERQKRGQRALRDFAFPVDLLILTQDEWGLPLAQAIFGGAPSEGNWDRAPCGVMSSC